MVPGFMIAGIISMCAQHKFQLNAQHKGAEDNKGKGLMYFTVEFHCEIPCISLWKRILQNS